MSKFPGLVDALMRGQVVSTAYLVWLDFGSGARFLSDLAGPFRDVNGQIWEGLGQLGSVSDIERSGTAADTVTLTLSGVDPGLSAGALHASADSKGRFARVFEQFYDVDTRQPVEKPVCYFLGRMDVTRIKADGPGTRSIIMTLESVFLLKRRPALAFLSDTDQRKLHPGDRGAEQIPALVQANPKFGLS